MQAIQQAATTICGTCPAVLRLAGTTDANLMIDSGGLPTVIFGPGDLAVCHKRVGFVPIDELVSACKVYMSTIVTLLGTA